jgi:carboxypeptidase family protein
MTRRTIEGSRYAGLVVFFACLSAGSNVWAQNSGISGVVRDTTGAALPGVTVEASSPALIEKVRTVTTDGEGLYNIVGLRPGSYVVAFTLAGFSTARREGIELTANFTANVNAELRVGGIEETLTVTGQSPLVDVQNVVQQRVVSRDLLDTLPTGKTIPAFAALTPGVVLPPTGQDVGGSKGEISFRMTIHGGKQGDQKLLQDGMRYNSMEGGGTGRGFFLNPASAQEITIELGLGNAEYETGGVQVNTIPRSGGNEFVGYYFSSYTNDALQNTNLSDELRRRGITRGNQIERIWDFNVGLGGPISRDRLWFYTAHRLWGNNNQVPEVYFNSTQDSWFYTPDLSRPAVVRYRNESHNARLTWQASQRNTVNVSYEYQNNCDCTRDLGSGIFAPEAVANYKYSPNHLVQTTWRFPVSNRLLLDAGATMLYFNWPNLRQPGVTTEHISVLELSKNFRYRSAATGYGERFTPQVNEQVSLAYVTGTHAFKTGFFLQQGWRRHGQEYNGEMSYTFLNSAPNRVTLYATPLVLRERQKANLGIYAQDQWRIGRLSLNGGLRFDYFNAFVPEQHLPAGRFVPARDFGEVRCVPCWTDLSPRISAAYNLFGNGKTAVKVALGRYLAAETVNLARANNPVQTSVNTASRTWTDFDGDFVPDCDFTNPLTNAECGPLSPSTFGQTRITTRYSDDVLRGHRNMNWQLSTGVQQEVTPQLAVNVGYFRTSFANFLTTDNLYVSPQNFDEYCVTAPRDSRLPDGGGQRICGLFDVSRDKFGLTDNLVTKAENFGEQTEVYNGVDVNFNFRGPGGSMLSGGTSTGRTATSACYVVDSPGVLRFCEVIPHYQTQFKMSGAYTLPYAVQFSATYQNLPGIPITASYVATNAEIRLSLGRDLSAGSGSTATIDLIAPETIYEKRITQMDIRFAKSLRFGQTSAKAMFDVYNLFNANSILAIQTRFGDSWLQPTQILDARLFKFGLQVEF